MTPRPSRTGRKRAERAGWPFFSSRDGSEAQLLRILHILARASNRGSVGLSTLAAELSVPEERVLDDLACIEGRSDYLPPEMGAAIRVERTADGICVVNASGDFHRPLLLTSREMAAVALGLRLAALSPSLPVDAGVRENLIERLEDDLAAGSSGRAGWIPVAGTELEPDGAGIRETLQLAVRERRACDVEYGGPKADPTGLRRLHPYRMISAEARWYVIGYCERAGEVRQFRTDRVRSVELTDARFTVPDGFDPEDFVMGGRVLRTGDGDHGEAVVRYHGPSARLMAETTEGEWRDDGTFEVRWPVLDSEWLVGHVLGHGGDAVVVEPAELREQVREVAGRW